MREGRQRSQIEVRSQPLEPVPAALVRHRETPPPGEPFDARGELRFFEFSYRVGLLLGAGIFFHEALGFPWERNLMGVAGMLLAALLVLTMTLQWRVLGDWRRRTQQFVLLLAILALSFPVAAALSPALGVSMMPDYLETAAQELYLMLGRVPGLAFLLDTAKGFVSFLFFMFAVLVLIFGNGKSRTGLTLLGLFLAGICLFFYPTIECILGFVFLFMYFYSQWETPVMMPDRLRRHLLPIQLDFLRELLRQGSLTTGETKIYLDNNPAHFGELLDLRLVEYDTVARDVLPGKRLLHDPASAALESAFGIFRRGSWILVGLVYIIMPDLIPGPIDDLVVMFLCAGGGTGVLSNLFGSSQRALRRR